MVHAKAGNRADYGPVESPFGAADDPVAIARGLLAATGSPLLYIADLDAIAGTGNHFELVRGLADALQGTTVWIDAGFSHVADCAFWLPLGATLVIGSESLAGVDDWLEIRAGVRRKRRAVARFRRRRTERPGSLFDDPSLWPGRLIVMNLARVGTEAGPDLDRLKSVIDQGRRPRRVCRRRRPERARSRRHCRIGGASGALTRHGAPCASARHPKRDRRPLARAAIVIRALTRPSVRNPAFGATAESGPDHLIYRVAPDLGVLPFNQPRTGGERRPSSRSPRRPSARL